MSELDSRTVMTRRTIVALGIGQCVNWGVLYYAFAVLVVPIQHELGVTTWTVTGAFSLALLMSAAVAPAVGRWADRDHGPRIIQAGGVAGAALLAAWTLTGGVVMLYVVWAALGICMSATLYEPAFVIIGRAFADPSRRLRALAAVTLFGGLASTVFLPLTAILVGAMTWRGAVLVLALVLAVSTGVTRIYAFPAHAASSRPAVPMSDTARPSRGGADSPQFVFIAAAFSLTSLASAAFTTNLVPALGERGIPFAAAAMLGGLIGVMQLPGHALLMHGMFAQSPPRLLAISLALQAAGLCGVAIARSLLAAAGGTMCVALGAGLTTLVRPHLIQTLFVREEGGFMNGRVARHQQLARAAGPLAVAWMAGRVGYTAVFAALAATFATAAVVSPEVFSRKRLAALDDAPTRGDDVRQDSPSTARRTS